MLGDSGDAYTLEAVAITVGALFCTRIAVIPAACSASGGRFQLRRVSPLYLCWSLV